MKPELIKHPANKGFTLVEVMVAVIVTAVGLLGLAKMQALAISATKNSGSRSLIALQTESLAGMMHANKAYWANPTAGVLPGFTASGTTISNDATGVLNAPPGNNCTVPGPLSCTPQQLAAVDVLSWITDLNTQFPTYNAKVICTGDTGFTPVTLADLAPPPLAVSCTIFVTWQEKLIALNKNTATGATSQVTTQTFSVFVKP